LKKFYSDTENKQEMMDRKRNPIERRKISDGLREYHRNKKLKTVVPEEVNYQLVITS